MVEGWCVLCGVFLAQERVGVLWGKAGVCIMRGVFKAGEGGCTVLWGKAGVSIMRGVFREGEGVCIMGEGWCVHYEGRLLKRPRMCVYYWGRLVFAL